MPVVVAGDRKPPRVAVSRASATRGNNARALPIFVNLFQQRNPARYFRSNKFHRENERALGGGGGGNAYFSCAPAISRMMGRSFAAAAAAAVAAAISPLTRAPGSREALTPHKYKLTFFPLPTARRA